MVLSQGLDASLLGLLGLLIGSFLNVVIYRLPVMLEAQWKAECAEMSGKDLPAAVPFNLMAPRSRCQHCGHQLIWYENIPVISYLMLGGKCSACKQPISLRYPAVELACGALFFFCAWRWGATPTALLWSGFAAALLTLAMIDWDTTLLPDNITLPLLWAGLIAAALGLTHVAAGRVRFGVPWVATCRCGWCTGASSWSRARKAWVLATSSCSRLWVPGLAGRLWCPSF
jgi:leader peptidase (prepilin peptidase)/N-methyltransferase